MNKRFFHGRGVALLFALSVFASLAAAQKIQSVPALKKHFDAEGMKGTFVLYDLAENRMEVYDEARAARRYSPASTFKIANALIGLDARTVKDADEVFPYDGKPHPFKQWERDLSLREAMKVSSLPVYQALARRTGRKVMTERVRDLGYGNARIGSRIDRFWIDGSLAISAVEQTKFLAKLARDELPVDKAAMRMVRDMVLQERLPGADVYYKTGWLFNAREQLGWLVGWVVKDGKTYAFALNMDMKGPEDTAKRWPIARACLTALGKL